MLFRVEPGVGAVCWLLLVGSTETYVSDLREREGKRGSVRERGREREREREGERCESELNVYLVIPRTVHAGQKNCTCGPPHITLN